MVVSDFHISGNKTPAFALDGRLTGVSNLTLTENRVLQVGDNASNALIQNRTYVATPVDGQLTLGVVNLEASSKVLFSKHVELGTDLLTMRQRSVLSAATMLITVKDAHLEGGSSVISSGRGPKEGSGPGEGSSINSAGSGAGHGGQGGPSTTVSGGAGYGSFVYPIHPGSAGGQGAGGIGGGGAGSTIKVILVQASIKMGQFFCMWMFYVNDDRKRSVIYTFSF